MLSGNTNDAYAAINNRTDLVLLHGSTSFNLRLDGTGFVGTDEGSPHTGHFGLEKISLTTNQRAFDVTLGDLYLRVGKGLTLDLTRVTALYRDTSLRGAQARVRTRYVDGEIFGGWVNPLAMDHFMELPRDIPSDMIGGARVEARPNREVIIGAHYVGGGMQSPQGVSRHATHALGASVELPDLAHRVSLYAEFDYLSRAQELEIIDGYGTYFSGSGHLGPLTALVEFKFYRHLQFLNDFGSEENTFIYNRPPTLTRTKAELINNHDVIGPRVRLDLRVGPWSTLLFTNYGHFIRSDASPGASFFDEGITVNDIYGGFQQSLPGGALDISGGYRWDIRTDEAGQAITDYSQIFVAAELSLVVFRGQSLELEAEYRGISRAAAQYWDLYLSVGYRPWTWLSAGFSYEYSSEFTDPDLDDDIGVQNNFGGVRATVYLTPSSFARLFAGSTHGGMRCIDGFCREIPPFIGAKLELVLQL